MTNNSSTHTYIRLMVFFPGQPG